MHRHNTIQDCKYCGRDHQRGKCQAYGQKCKNCGKMNHFKNKCMSKTASYRARKPVHRLLEEQSESDPDKMYVDMVKANEDWEVDLKINNKEVRFKIDTGAQCNVILESIYRQTGAQLEKSKAKLVTYGV